MKKKTLISVLLLGFAFSALDVSAYTKGDGFTSNYGKKHENRIDFIQGDFKRDGENYDDRIYYVIPNEGEANKYYAYCIDPHLVGGTDLKIDRLLNSNDKKDKYEIGALAILAGGKNKKPDKVASDNAEKRYYEATSTALRMYVNGVWGKQYGEDHTETKYLGSYLRTFYEWLKADTNMQEAFKKVTGKSYETALKGYSKYKELEIVDSVASDTKALLKVGLEAAANAKETSEAILEGFEVVSEKQDGDKKIIIFEIGLSGFNEEVGKFYYKGISDKAENTTVTFKGYTFSVDATDYKNLTETDNVVKILKDANKSSIYLTYEVTGSQDNDKKCTATFNINYEYSDPTVYNGAVLMPDSSKAASGLQRFFMYSDDPIEEKVAIKSETCSSTCKTSFKLPNVCEDGAESSIENGKATYAIREGIDENEKIDIEKCILENVDAAGNSYEFIDGEIAGILEDNDYCSVYCKEDYDISVPYKIETESGRYFQIGVDIAGQKDCYTSKIDKDAFDEDMKELKAELINAYNEWQKIYELANATSQNLKNGNQLTCQSVICDSVSWYNAQPSQGRIVGSPNAYQKRFYYTNGKYLDANGNFNNNATPKYEEYGKVVKEQAATCSTKFALGNSCTNANYYNSQMELFQSFNGGRFTGFVYPIAGNVWLEGIFYNNTLTITSKHNNEYYYGRTLGIYEYSMYGNLNGVVQLNNQAFKLPDQLFYCGFEQTPNVCETSDPLKEFKSAQEAAKAKLPAAEAELDRIIEKLKESVDKYNGCAADKNAKTYSEKYNQKAYWDMTYNFAPEIEYSYDEPIGSNETKWIQYAQNYNGHIMRPVSEQIKAEYCGVGNLKCQMTNSITTLDDKNIQTTNRYTSINQDYTPAGDNQNGTFKDEKIFNCEKGNDGKYTCKQMTYKVTTTKYVHKVATSEGSYDTPRIYYSMHDSGSIKVIDYNGQLMDNADLVDGLPVGIATPQGTHFYILGFANLGEYYDVNNKLGRIYGTDITSLSSVLKESSSTINGDYLNANEYACTYTVSENTCSTDDGVIHTKAECEYGEKWSECKKRLCPTTKSYCVKGSQGYYSCQGTTSYDAAKCSAAMTRDQAIAMSDENYDCCPDCTVQCVGPCLHTEYYPTGNGPSGSLNVEYRPISPSDVNPNNKTLGFNWDISNKNTLVANKAYNTIYEIEDRYDITITNPDVNQVEDYVLSVELTPSLTEELRKYNKTQLENNQYRNETLECHDYKLTDEAFNTKEKCTTAGYTWDPQENVCAMTNIFCYSTVINDLIENGFAENFISESRADALNSSHSNGVEYNRYQNELRDYGTIKNINDYWTIYQHVTLDINGDGIQDIGPSWK